MAKRRILNRKLVVEKAAELADAAGSAEAVSLSALAAALNVRPPSLYSHVAGLADLQRGMGEFAVQRLLDDLRSAVAGQIGREALFRAAMAYRAYARRHPGIYPLTIRAPDPGDKPLAGLAEQLLQMVRLLLGSYGLKGKQALHAVRGFRACLHGYVTLEQAGAFRLPLSHDVSFQRLVSIYLEGLKRHPAH